MTPNKILGETIVFDPPDEPVKPAAVDISGDPEQKLAIKLLWNDQFELHSLGRHEEFKELIRVLAEREKCARSNIVLMLNDKVVLANETPEMLCYSVNQMITGRVVADLEDSAKSQQKDFIKVKVRTQELKKPMKIKIRKNLALSAVYAKCSEMFKIDMEHLKLKFDGETLDQNKTPLELDLEGGEMIDCISCVADNDSE